MSYPVKISVITVTYNCKDLLQSTITSICSQSYKNIEYIIIDGASTDGTIDVIKNNQLDVSFWMSENDCGVYDAMNKGIAKSNGDYVIFMNAGDTFFSSDVVERVANQLTSDIDIIYGDTNMILSIGNYLLKPETISDNNYMPFCHQSVFVKRDLLLRNLFDLSYKICADRHQFFRLYLQQCRYAYVPIIFCNYEAELGLSSSNYIRREYEKGRITGQSKSRLWQFKFKVFVLKCKIKTVVKRCLPLSILYSIRKYNARRIYNQ